MVGRDDRLGVAFCGELRTVLLRQLLAQFEVVVDLTVEVDGVPGRVVLGAPGQRLVRVIDVDDREPVEAVDDLTFGPGVGLVGAAMPLAAQGAADGVPRVRRVILTATDQSKQAAHAVSHTLCLSKPKS